MRYVQNTTVTIFKTPQLSLNCAQLNFSPGCAFLGLGRRNHAFFIRTYPFKGNMHMISPDRTRFCCHILTYLVTIHLLYGTGCLSYWFCYNMLRLDSSEMLPGSQKGANMGLRQKSWTHTRGSAILTPATGAWNVGTGNHHVTRADCHVPVWKRWNTASYISRRVNTNLNTKAVDGRGKWSFCLNSTK